MRLLLGDSLKILREEKENSVDSIVCDPPYGINILNESWDKEIPNLGIWKECFRVLKPGGHILAFSSARLYHHQAVLMEQAGFETFNMLTWIYGSGIPKGKNLSREFDRINDIPKPDDAFRSYLRAAIRKSPYKIIELEKLCQTNGIFNHYLGKSQPIYPSFKVWRVLKEKLKLDSTYDDFFNDLEEKRSTYRNSQNTNQNSFSSFQGDKSKGKYTPKTELAKKWDGWKYGKQSVRPSMEPIYFGQKPPVRPVRKNVAHWNVGALNIEGSKKLEADGRIREMSSVLVEDSSLLSNQKSLSEIPFSADPDEIIFCEAKPSSKERSENFHPTVKPINLMSRLINLVTPPDGICLDPFMGSGTTGVASIREGFHFFGIEKDDKYFDLARSRIEKQKSA